MEQKPPADVEAARIKDVAEALDSTPLIDQRMLALTRWIADYYACSWGQALDAVVPAGVKKHAGTRIATFLMVPDEAIAAVRAGTINPPLSAKQAAAMEILARGEMLTVADICRMAKCTSIPIKALRERGLVRQVRKRLPVGLKGASSRGLAGGLLETESGRASPRRVLVAPTERTRGGSQAGVSRDRRRWFCPILDPWSHIERQDRSLPGCD